MSALLQQQRLQEDSMAALLHQQRLQEQLQMQQAELERQRFATQELNQLALVERQQAATDRAVAEQMAKERQAQQVHVQNLEAEHVKLWQRHQEQILELETALLAQSSARERELQAQLRDLDQQFEEVEAADSRNKMRAAEVAEMASSRSFDAERRRLAAADSPIPGSIDEQTLPAANLYSPSPMLSPMPSRSEYAHAAPLHISSSEYARAAPSHMRKDGQDTAGLQLPTGLPRVYEAAISIVLQHGWHVLHGGENAGPAWTALHWASSEGRLDVCDVLLRARADPGHRDEVGKTPLDYALENGQLQVAAMLGSAAETEASHIAHSTNWSPLSQKAEAEDSPGGKLVAALAAQGTWPRDEQRV